MPFNDDIKDRQNRWGSLISDLEGGWDHDNIDVGEDQNQKAPGLSSISTWASARSNTTAGSTARTTTMLMLPLITPVFHNRPVFGYGGGIGTSPSINNGSYGTAAAVKVKNWITSHRQTMSANNSSSNNSTNVGVSKRKKYLEKSARILHSLVSNNIMVPRNDEIINIHPNFIRVENILVKESISVLDGSEELTADFVECGDSIFSAMDETRKKYLAMDALGRVAYELVMRGEGPSVHKFCPDPRKSGGTSRNEGIILSKALNINDGATEEESKNNTEDLDDILDMFRKNPRGITSENDRTGITSAMLEANVPFPLCRLISDLLDDEDAMLGRSEQSFSSFADVLSDLTQMVDNPDGFLHASLPNRWKLVFGEKLYGRDGEMKNFINAADRVASLKHDPIFEGLSGLSREVVMVSGNAGAGKSKLVKLGGLSLKKRGWRFLRCKFDRVVSYLIYSCHDDICSVFSLTHTNMNNTHIPRHHFPGPPRAPLHSCLCIR